MECHRKGYAVFVRKYGGQKLGLKRFDIIKKLAQEALPASVKPQRPPRPQRVNSQSKLTTSSTPPHPSSQLSKPMNQSHSPMEAESIINNSANDNNLANEESQEDPLKDGTSGAKTKVSSSSEGGNSGYILDVSQKADISSNPVPYNPLLAVQ